MKLFGKEYSKSELLKYVGDVLQIGGIETAELTQGASKGVQTVTVTTADGLSYVINPDCGMGISSCSYKGIPFCWKSGTGVTNPGLYDAQLAGWLRSFNGGLLVTCGLSQIGAPCIDDGVSYGLHGRISNTPAEIVSVKGDWADDRYYMCFEGVARESMALGQRLVLRRKIKSWLDSSEIIIDDTITNESWNDTPLLISYHINFGYPFITENAKVKFNGLRQADYFNDASKTRGFDRIDCCDHPTKDFSEQIYLQNLEPLNGFREFEVENYVDGMKLAANVLFSENLKHLIHWRQFGEGDYVLGFEPANTTIRGRARERAEGNVVMLKAQESVKYSLIFKFSCNK